MAPAPPKRTASARISAFGAAAPYSAVTFAASMARPLLTGVRLSAAALEQAAVATRGFWVLAVAVCPCDGIWLSVSGTASCPACSPMKNGPYSAKPIGTRPRRSGKAKVVCPLPPNCVPSSENNAWF